MFIEFQLPLHGLNEALPVSNEPGATSGYMLNVRPRDVLERRLRIGQRPGLKKAYSQQISSAANPIVWLGFLTTVD